MNPDTQQPIVTPSYTPYTTSEPPQKSSGKKKIILIIAGIAVLIAGAAAFFLLQSKDESKKDSASNKTGSPVTFSTADKAVTYAGNAVYDACNLLPVNILQKHTAEFDKSYKTLGSGFRLKDPLVIDHGYYDRDISAVIGKDGTARDPGILITEKSTDSTIRANSFMKLADSHCFYGQGQNFDSYLARTYITQPPTPIHPKLTAYLDELKKTSQLVATVNGIEMYVETPKEGDSSIAAMFRKGPIVAFLSSRNADLMQAASEVIIDTLSKPPAGPMLAKFPTMFSKMTDSCNLLPAKDFERLFSKPASSLVTETINLTESEPYTAYRECARIEDDRLKEGEISNARIQLTESQTEKQTKQRITALKEDKHNATTSIKDLGDEAYSIKNTLLGESQAGVKYSLVVRVGKTLITVKTTGESKDSSIDSFVSRSLPVAKTIVENYKKQ